MVATRTDADAHRHTAPDALLLAVVADRAGCAHALDFVHPLRLLDRSIVEVADALPMSFSGMTAALRYEPDAEHDGP